MKKFFALMLLLISFSSMAQQTQGYYLYMSQDGSGRASLVNLGWYATHGVCQAAIAHLNRFADSRRIGLTCLPNH